MKYKKYISKLCNDYLTEYFFNLHLNLKVTVYSDDINNIYTSVKTIQDIHNEVRDVRNNAKEAFSHTDNTKAQALLETSFEVLTGLEKAFDHFPTNLKKLGSSRIT